MYLSRVEIDTKNRKNLHKLSHLGAYHDWVEQSFPEEIANHERLRHLWRIDELNGKKYLLLLSEDKPDLDRLEKYGVAESAQTKDYDSYLNKLRLNQKYRFRLAANPTYRIGEGAMKGKIVPHVTVAQQMKWLLDRAEKNGFKIAQDDNQVLSFDITDRDWPLLRKKGAKKVKLSRATFEGILTITDIEKFKSCLIHGIGREKAYGMGLLTVIALRNDQ